MPWGRSSKSSKAEEQPVGNPMETQTSDASLEDAAVEIDRQPSATKSTRGGGDAPGIGAVLAGTTTPSRIKSSKKGGSDGKATRWRSFCNVLGFIPWGAIVSMMLVIAGLTITAIKGKAAGDTATALLAAAESSKSGVFPKAVEVYNASWVVTLGLAGGCIAVILLTASARLVQKLRKAGKSSKGKWGRCCFGFLHYESGLALVFVLLCTVWFLANLMFLATWGVSVQQVKGGSAAALATSAELSTVASLYQDTLAALPAAVHLNINNTATWGRVNLTLSAAIEQLKTMSPDLAPGGKPLEDGAVAAADLVCPSQACVNMNFYPVLKSEVCLCSTPQLTTLKEAATAAYSSLGWPLIGFACLVVGGLLGSVQLAVDSVLLTADQAWMTVMRRKSRPGRSPTRPPHPNFSDAEKGQFMTTPGSTLPKRPAYLSSPSLYAAPTSAYTSIHARSASGL